MLAHLSRVMRHLSLCLLVLALALAAGMASAQSPEEELRDETARAMEAFHALDLDGARTTLEHAIQRAEAQGARGPLLARAYVSLGTVLSSGLHERDAALSAFVRALREDPDVQTDPLVSTPEVSALFAEARGQDTALAPAGAPAGEPASVPTALGGLCDPHQPCERGLACEAGVCSLPTAQPPERLPARPRFARLFLRAGLGLGAPFVHGGVDVDRGPPEALRASVRDESPTAAQRHAEDAGWQCAVVDGPDGASELSDCSLSLRTVGFVAQLMLDLTLGVELGARFSLAGYARLQPLGHGRGSLAGLLLAVHAAWALVPARERGFTASVFAGPGLGRIQAQTRVQAAGGPWVTSGPLALDLGISGGYRFGAGGGLHLTVVLRELMPAWLTVVDTSFGPELVF